MNIVIEKKRDGLSALPESNKFYLVDGILIKDLLRVRVNGNVYGFSQPNGEFIWCGADILYTNIREVKTFKVEV